MADREIVAATLAAALLARETSGRRSDPAGYAVMVYRQVLNALVDSESSTPPQRPGSPIEA